MGKICSFYLIDQEEQHDTQKICFDWNFQENESETNDRRDLIYKKITGRTDKQDDYYHVISSCKLCPKCSWFLDMNKPNEYIRDKFNINHSYNNPIFRSDFNIEKIIIGNTNREYTYGIYKIDEKSLDFSIKQFKEIEPPLRKNDIDAHEETIYVLKKLQSWFTNTKLQKPMIIQECEL
jgi:hypothetical protein